ncbi:hypothetical protein PsYK624_097240 [Phanerochaete sordida]|uniref:Uncharacterized protein n=1 Tax=Phanerochaete sordida TaxID=48140 RepID=A0A9P3LFR9_9APHY|nr:hypothetical protein PsYK624_097240 [Phanerochaete sordida]
MPKSNAEASSSKQNKQPAENAPAAIAKAGGPAGTKPARVRAKHKDTPRRPPKPVVYHQYKNEDDARAAFNRGKGSQWQHLGSLMGEKQKEAEALEEQLRRDAQRDVKAKAQRKRKGKAPERLLREPSQNVQGIVKSPVAGSSKLAQATVHKPQFPAMPSLVHATYESVAGPSGDQPAHRTVATGLHALQHDPTARPQVGAPAGARPQATGKRPAAEEPEVIEISSDSDEERPLCKTINPRKRSSPTPAEGSRKKARTMPPATTAPPEAAPPAKTSKGKGVSKGKAKKVQDPPSQEATASPPPKPKKTKKAKKSQDATTDVAVPAPETKPKPKPKAKTTSRKGKAAAPAKDPQTTTKAAARTPAHVPPPIMAISTWQPASSSATPARAPSVNTLSSKKAANVQKNRLPDNGEDDDEVDFLAAAMQGSDDAQDTDGAVDVRKALDAAPVRRTAAHDTRIGAQDVASGSHFEEEPEDFLADALSEADDDDDEEEDFLAGELSEADDDDTGSCSTTVVPSSNGRQPAQSSKVAMPAATRHCSPSAPRSPPATSLPIIASAGAILAHEEDEPRDDGNSGSDDSLFG